ncbi:hypothetical protein Y032_0043g785 [Ancylostoma ceylanicum]|uniref:Uncharacterized protein n=1 Tax=Ancylostoma ceylanicum TaxID=53326 RepID=A0A016UFE5_9BILA|nr:hypothetical protein Y032_0043g785 [Ancylostoma ceylanicum]
MQQIPWNHIRIVLFATLLKNSNKFCCFADRYLSPFPQPNGNRALAVLLLTSNPAKYFECWRILLRCNRAWVTFTCDITAYLLQTMRSRSPSDATLAKRCLDGDPTAKE